ncbi:hypothetical protein LVY74_00450 [Acinetobacter sp. ME22]|uniref:hypothetical protein n=1 Tax=Acinetobacter sp. ME22 TaxID=2904802 RepID=UPI001EDBBBD1|nr:hypothetical protein [Acinetobacter sp. ME22]MCG2572029.1 hypothetical protein [Acinetobacter sp. ME22]
MDTMPHDPLKAIQNAWVHMLLDFRAWMMPETQQIAEWKMRETVKAIRSCRAQLMDDSEGMVAAYRKNMNDGSTVGTSSFFPVLLTATAVVDMPPDASQLMGVPYFVEGVLNDTLVKIRVVPQAVRAQVAFYATNPHDARSVCSQLCTYLSDDWRRRIDVAFKLGSDIAEKFKFIVFDNTLSPNPVPSEATNISIFTVDVTLVGYVPHVLGLGAHGQDYVDYGYDPVTGIPLLGEINDGVVIQADQYDGTQKETYTSHLQVNADKDTGEITVTKKEIDDE